MTEFRTDTVMSSTLQLETMGFPVELSNFGGIIKEIRRVSDPDKAQIIWDGIKTVRAQKQIPALPRLSRYMHRYVLAFLWLTRWGFVRPLQGEMWRIKEKFS